MIKDTTSPQRIDISGLSQDERKKAAELIQKTYRGHRTRRELKGYALSPSARWFEAVRDAQYKNTTAPRSPDTRRDGHLPRAKWQTVTEIARRAGADDESSSPSDISLSEASDRDHEAKHERPKQEQEERRQSKALAQEKRKRTAKMMDLQYFLEMVDHKHRYGSNLRKYHAYWKSQDTNQNFFYWLDYGEGTDVELEECSRERLQKEQVRYLSREERLQYLVKVDKAGRLIWAKNGEPVWTKDELYRDSIMGIVPADDAAPSWKHKVKSGCRESSSDEESTTDEGGLTQTERNRIESERYVDQDFHRAKGPAKLKHVSAGVFFNHMMKQSIKKGHKWIFVADTSFRLYIGYKQSGAFQHSSFLHGSRILAAGQIKVKRGQLRRLSPLSGHYRPPTANFRAFVHSLEEEGVDMSHVSISRSYAILVGMESYTQTRRQIKKAEKTVTHQADKIVRPQKAKQEEQAQQDTSQSAQRERDYLEKQRLQEMEKQAPHESPSRKFNKQLSNAWGRLTGRTTATDKLQGVTDERGVPGTGPEDGVPAPEGGRHFEQVG